MKKVYSKRIGGEVYALDAEQLKVFAKSGYEVPAPEAVIADAGAVKLLPPKGKQAYAVFNCETGVFAVRTSPATLKNGEIGVFVGEVVQAAMPRTPKRIRDFRLRISSSPFQSRFMS